MQTWFRPIRAGLMGVRPTPPRRRDGVPLVGPCIDRQYQRSSATRAGVRTSYGESQEGAKMDSGSSSHSDPSLPVSCTRCKSGCACTECRFARLATLDLHTMDGQQVIMPWASALGGNMRWAFQWTETPGSLGERQAGRHGCHHRPIYFHPSTQGHESHCGRHA